VYSLAIVRVENYDIDLLSYFGKTNPETVIVLQ